MISLSYLDPPSRASDPVPPRAKPASDLTTVLREGTGYAGPLGGQIRGSQPW
jgi:hypothetical protein